MTPDTTELLSRYLDGDLDQQARGELEARLAADHSLRDELEALRRVRSAVRELAATETAPVALDRLVSPLERSSPPVPRLRPFLRVVAIAATLVVGTAVVLRLSQQSGPRIPRPTTPTKVTQAEDRSRAAPSSTSSGREPVPAGLHEVDRLASRAPSPGAARQVRAEKGALQGAPEAGAPPPARFNATEVTSKEGERSPVRAADRDQNRSGKALVPARGERAAPSAASAAKRERAVTVTASRAAPEPVRAQPAAGGRAQASEEGGLAGLREATETAAAYQASWSLEVAGRAIPVTVRPPAALLAGRYDLRLSVREDGRIVAALPRPEDKNASSERRRATALDRACELLTGTTLPGVPAGEHDATLIVSPRSAR